MRALVEDGQFFQKQLERYKVVDSLIIKLALANAVELKLTKDEIGSLVALILRSPKAVSEIEKDIRQIYHKDFAVDHLITIGQFDLYRMYKKAKKFDYEGSVRGFDDSDLEALTKLDEILEKAGDRAGQPRRTIKNDDVAELRLYFEASERGVARYSNDYTDFTGQTAHEQYSVKRMHTREVPDGTDSKGNPKTRTEVYYTDETVYPTFENILSDSYDTGSGADSRLDGIRRRAAAMVAREQPSRREIADAERAFAKVLEDYGDLIATGATKKKWRKPARTSADVGAEMTSAAAELEKSIAAYAPYAQSSDAAILAQYGRDDAANFRGRNGAMLARLENMKDLLLVLRELLERKETQIRPMFHIWDYTDWMYKLRSLRNRNYAVKAFLFSALVGAAGAYALVPEVQAVMDPYVQPIARVLGLS